MRVLVACEFSGRVRQAFTEKGHEAWSCDLLPTEIPGKHYQGDVRDILYDNWDMMLAFPPCTHLASSGARHFYKKEKEIKEALEFVQLLLDAPIDRIALENPVGLIGSRIRKSDQIIQPWQFGEEEKKATCLWLKNLPLLVPTKIVEVRQQKVANSPDSKDRWKHRSRTYWGIARAMADQWG